VTPAEANDRIVAARPSIFPPRVCVISVGTVLRSDRSLDECFLGRKN
jgi:hypothetical protein